MEIVRDYKFSDPQLVLLAREYVNLLSEHLAVFTAINVRFDEAYKTDLISKIDDAEAIPSDQVIIDKQAAFTAVANETQDACVKHFSRMRYYIEEAFPDRKEIWRQFGYNDISDARRSDKEMLRFMDGLQKTATTYATELTNANMPVDVLDNIEPLKSKLQTDVLAKESYKKERTVITARRIEKLNTVWAMLKDINKAAQVVFIDDPVMLNMFEFPQSHSSN